MEEEIYLVFLDLFKRYAAEIGHSIDRFKPKNLNMYLVFQVNITLNYCETMYSISITCQLFNRLYQQKHIFSMKVLRVNKIKK